MKNPINETLQIAKYSVKIWKMDSSTRRNDFKMFWGKYSHAPNTNITILNSVSEDFESSDREYILASLPDLNKKDVADINAGIGQFTSVIVNSARSVISTDFIESFIEKNRERNSHFKNIEYQIGDPVELKLGKESMDFVFTNWLLMYLTDAEVVEFVSNVIRWLKPNGFFHIWESCSESSCEKIREKSMHNAAETKPTHYRYSSLYINLIRAIRFRDENNKLWRLDIKWSCSVPTYIHKSNNWKQVHWLAEKVPAEIDAQLTDNNKLVELLSTWNEEQKIWDAKLDGEQYMWTDSIFSRVLAKLKIEKQSTILVFTPRGMSPFVHFNSHMFTQKFDCNIWNVELVPEFYHTSLTKATTKKDQRVRYGWNENLKSSINYWQQKQAIFDEMFSTELFSTANDSELKALSSILKPGARLISLEPVASSVNQNWIPQRLALCGFEILRIEDVTKEAMIEQVKYLEARDLPTETELIRSNWVLVQAKLE
ncbi:unnamed protein product [Caenorhabditis angaria]|uniref:phosphoethanolamine N-methyltransferase n=1 Tax=Caenorhabditis angaria TaxID=860376 RepID=A0A9P1IZH0_9PELO|nr:unnamed protein product [Caenorhabditis angaria]